MRIDQRFAPTSLAGSTAKPADPARPRFSVEGGSPGRRPGAAAGAATLATLDAILALQSDEEEPGSRRRRSARRGQNLLDGLDRLKASLLSGRVSARELAGIARDLRTGRETSGDPGLDGVVAEIELRASVELAKLGRGDLA